MQNAKSSAIRTLSKTNIASTVVTATIDVSKTMVKYFNGEIDGVECLTELGEKGTGMVSSAMFAAIGQVVIPIPVLGGLIGGMVGYALSSACYGILTSSLQEAKMAHEERLRIEADCAEAIEMIRQYRAEMEKAISLYLSDYMLTFQTAFDGIKRTLEIGDVDGFILGANTITRKLGGEPQFNTMGEFESLMAEAPSLRL
jgi:hypothetical protein